MDAGGRTSLLTGAARVVAIACLAGLIPGAGGADKRKTPSHSPGASVARAGLHSEGAPGAIDGGSDSTSGTGSQTALPPSFTVTKNVSVESAIDFTTADAITVHHLPIDQPVAAEASIELTVDGAFGIGRARADVEGVFELQAGGTQAGCASAMDRNVIAPVNFAQIAADRVVTVTVRNDQVDSVNCAVNRHTVRLSYATPADRIDFPPARVGAFTTAEITLRNQGGPDVQGVHFEVHGDAFSAVPGSIVLYKDRTATVVLQFQPPASGPFTGYVDLLPDSGAAGVRLPLNGDGLEQPAIGIDPPSLQETLPGGHETSRPFLVSNPGSAPVELDLSVVPTGLSGGPPLCDSPAIWVLEGETSALARIGLSDGSVSHLAPQIFGASALALDPPGKFAYISTILGELWRLDTVTGARIRLDARSGSISDLVMTPDGSALYLIRDPGSVERYDLAGAGVTTLASGLFSPRGIDLSADGDTLLVGTYGGLNQVETATGVIKARFPQLAEVGTFHLDPDGRTLYYIDSHSRSLETFDLITRKARSVLVTPGFTDVSFSSGGRFLFGLEWGGGLSRIALATGEMTRVASDLVSPRDLEVRADATCLGTFLTVTPSRLSLPGGGISTVTAHLSARGLQAGTHGASVLVREPGASIVLATLPVALTVTDAAHLRILGTPQIVEQETNENIQNTPGRVLDGTHVLFYLPLTVAPAGGGVLEITTAGNTVYETGVAVEGTTVGGQLFPQCIQTSHEFELPSSLLSSAAADGRVSVRLGLPYTDDSAQGCGGQVFAAKLSYAGAPESVDFGTVEAGQRVSVPLRVVNDGNQTLTLSHLRTIGDEFTVGSTDIEISPVTEAEIPVSLDPPAAGHLDGILRFETNDPTMPSVSLPLIAESVAPPEAVITPATIDAAVPVGASGTVILSISNRGSRPLDFTLKVMGSDAACPAEALLMPDMTSIDLATGEQKEHPQPHSYPWGSPWSIRGLVVDPTGRIAYLTFGPWNGGVSGGDWLNGGVRFLQGSGRAGAAAYRPDRDTVIFGSSQVRFSGFMEFDTRTNSITLLGEAGGGEGMAITRDGRTVYMTAGGLTAMDLVTGARRVVTDGLVSPQGVALSADETSAYVVDADRLVRVDLLTGVVTTLLTGLEGAEAVVVDTTTSIAYIGEEIQNRVTAFDLVSGHVSTFVEGIYPSVLALIPRAVCSGRFVNPSLFSGTVASGGSVEIPVKLETTELKAGLYTARLIVRGNDPSNPEVEIPVRFNVVGQNRPPVATMLSLASFECDGPGGASIPLSGAASSDPDSTPGTADDIASYEWLLNPGGAGEQLLASGTSATVRLPVGRHALGLRVTDHAGAVSTAIGTVTIVDTVPPTVSAVAEPALLWPPNHRMETVALHWQVADVCDPHAVVTVAGVTSNEPDDAPGGTDGNTTGDLGVVGAAPDGIATVALRAERSGNGPGRVYQVGLAASDFSANRSSATATIAVPHDQGGSSEPLLLRLKPGAAGGLQIDWPQVPGAVTYDLISGDLRSWRIQKGVLKLGEVKVLARGTAQVLFAEPAGVPPPPVGAALFYLIQPRFATGSAGYGTESAPYERVPTTCVGGCP